MRKQIDQLFGCCLVMFFKRKYCFKDVLFYFFYKNGKDIFKNIYYS